MYDKKNYKHLKDKVIEVFETRGVDFISYYCALMSIPVIVAYQFILEEMPEHEEEMKKRIKGIKDFFGYK